jgi:hypothetical protein
MPGQTFDEWVDGMKDRFRVIEGEIHALEQELLAERTRRTALWQLLQATTAEARALGARGGAYAAAGDGLRLSARRLALLTHSVEVAFTPAYVLRKMAVDMANLVPPQTIEYSPGNRASVTQREPARLVLANGTACHAVGADQFGLDVPMRSEVLGNIREFELHAVVQPVIHRARAEVSVVPSRSPRVCPPEALPVEQRLAIVAAAIRSFATVLGTAITPPTGFDLGLGRPTYESVGVFDFFRLFGVTNKRPRGPLPFLTALPAWADAGVKVGASVLVDKVRAMLTENGATLVDGPHFLPGNRFEITGEMTQTVKKKIACVTFGAHIRVRVRLNCSIRVVETNKVQFIAAQVGDPSVDVTSFPYLVPGLQDLIEAVVAEIIEHKIPNIHLAPDPESFDLATRLEVDLDATRLALYAALRF